MTKGPFKMKGWSGWKRKLYETPSGRKYYKNSDGSKTYIDTHYGKYTTEGKPSVNLPEVKIFGKKK